MTHTHTNLDTSLVRFRFLRRDQNGQWWTVWGDGCHHAQGGDAVQPIFRDEMLWSATGILAGRMPARATAVRHNTDLNFPLQYCADSIRNLKRGTNSHPLGPPGIDIDQVRRHSGGAQVSPDQNYEQRYGGYQAFRAAQHRAQAPDWRAGGAWARWLERAHHESQTPDVVYGEATLPLNTTAPVSAHAQILARATVAHLLPFSPEHCMVWIGTEAGFFPLTSPTP